MKKLVVALLGIAIAGGAIFRACKKEEERKMQKKILVLMIFFLSTVAVVAQSELGGGLYASIGIAHNYKFQLSKILKDMGTDKIPQISSSVAIGTHIDYRKVVYSVDLGVESMYLAKKQTRSTNLLANLSAGYQLFLPDKNSLIFSGNLSYEIYNVSSYLTKGSLDMATSAIIPTQFRLQLHQFMVGAKIGWRNEYTTIWVGYDFGCIPMSWTSNVVQVFNSVNERIDRIHFDVAYDIRKY
ncbi:MAG: hypothetical protein LBL13_09560 [Bacteroidales bacterium]|jgi:hypothetical protein|nr:hypothetical protein [Bacteroidales bacterium]